MGSGPVLPRVHRATSGKSRTLPGPQCPPVHNGWFKSPSNLVVLGTPVCVCWGARAEWQEEGPGGFRGSCTASPHPHTAFCISPFRFQSVQRV